jgi:hypothetical protein
MQPNKAVTYVQPADLLPRTVVLPAALPDSSGCPDVASEWVLWMISKYPVELAVKMLLDHSDSVINSNFYSRHCIYRHLKV